MEDKDPKPITINDILDQITKAPATPNQGVDSPRPNIPSSPTPAPRPNDGAPILPKPSSQILKPQTEIKLPSLGKPKEQEKDLPYSQSTTPTGSKLKLSIRTMASDLEKIGQGQKPLGEEVDRDIVMPKISPSTPPTSTSPIIPTIQAIPRSPSPIKPPIENHYHSEKVISKGKTDTNKSQEKEGLPSFLDANILKKSSKPPGEKVEYGLIVRIISSGIATGIISTVVLALVAYFTISYFFFNQEPEISIATPTPTISTSPTPTIEVNELNNIFSDVLTVDFQLPEQKEDVIPNIKSFVSAQTLEKKGFRRVNIINQSGQTVLFDEVLENLATSFPLELENFIKPNNLVFIYGQEESFTDIPIEKRTDIPLDKRFIFIVEVNDPNNVAVIMRNWESTLPADLKDIFDLDTSKEASLNFLDNERRGVQIRYKNFPLPDKSIDYSIVSSLTGRNYLIITNSRESMYSPADQIRGVSFDR